MECSNCHKNFCSKHLHDYNRCPNPKCRHIPFIYQSNPELKKKISDIINTCKICGQKCSNSQELKMHLKKCQMECSLCDFSGNKEMFWAHLIDKHKNQIIEKFKKNNNDNLNERNERDEEGFNIEEEEKNNGDFSSSVNLNQGSTYPKTNNYTVSSINIDDSDKFDEESQNNQNSNIQNSNYIKDFHDSNYTSNIEYMENNQYNPKNNNDCYKKESLVINSDVPEINNTMQILRATPFVNQQTTENTNVKMQQNRYNNDQFKIPFTERNSNNVIKVNDLIYCNSQNNDIKCNCCPDHICKIGCCLCVECMKNNCIRLGLNENQLINKEGRVATLCRGSYYCGYKYIKITKNVIGREFKNEVKCLNPGDPCESCKVLTKFMKEYSKIF